MLGDPHADGSLLAKEEVTMTFPEDVEISLKASYNDVRLTMWFPQVRIRLGEEEASLEGRFFETSIFKKDPVVNALQTGLAEFKLYGEEKLADACGDLSPRMLCFLKALAEHEAPFIALAEGRFRPHVTAELFFQL